MRHDRRRLGRFLLATTALTGALGATSAARAQNLPTGYSTAAGSVGFARASGTLTINQSSRNAIVNYQSFSIGQHNMSGRRPLSRVSLRFCEHLGCGHVFGLFARG